MSAIRSNADANIVKPTPHGQSGTRRATGRLFCWLRDGWCLVGIAAILFTLVNFVLGRVIAQSQARVGAELVQRPAFRAACATSDAAGLDALATDIAQTHDNPFDSRFSRWEPFDYWRIRPHVGTTISIDAAGLRRTVQATGAPFGAGARSYRVFCFGGSTMWGSGVPDQATIPSLLARRLSNAGFAVEVTNFGQPGYVSTQETIALLLELEKGNIPDVALFHDGFNDIGSALLNGAPGLAGDEYERGQADELFHRPTTLGLVRHWLLHLPVARLVAPNVTTSLAGRVAEQAAKTTDAALAQQIVRRYLANLRAAQALASGLQADAVFFWQPVVYLRRAPTPLEQETIQAHAGSALFHRRVTDLVRQAKAAPLLADPVLPRLTDLSSAFDDPSLDQTTVFFDDCHLGDRGNGIIATAMAAAVIPMLEARRARGQ